MEHPASPDAGSTFDDFLKKVEPTLKRILIKYRVPSGDAEDLLQQTLLVLLYQWDRVRDPEAWLVGTLRRQCLMYWRTQRRRIYSTVDSVLLECLSQPAEAPQERADLFADLASVIERLPARCRTLFRLRFRLGYELPEVAEKLGYRASSIGKITTRCLAALWRQVMASRLNTGEPANEAGEPEMAAGGLKALLRR
jgi:RNA polymerase sigma-70 factor (ECF subfamily)